MSLEPQKRFLEGLLTRPEKIVPDLTDDLFNVVMALEEAEPGWLEATFADARFPLANRKKLSSWLIGPSGEKIRALLSKPL